MTIGVDWARGPGDNDPFFGLTDGTNQLSIEYGDNAGGAYWLNEGTINEGLPTFSRSFVLVATGVGYNTSGHRLEIDYLICESGAVTLTEVRNSFGSALGPFSPPGGTALNGEDGLSLFIGMHDFYETLKVNSLSVVVADAECGDDGDEDDDEEEDDEDDD